MAKGCGGILFFIIVAIIVTNIVIKNFVADRLEEELA
ncbi:uncharacterized protein METZ01_LOCUS367929, partial [marine metagenome]